MPSSLFADMERNGSNQVDALDDHRALQIALDQLSLMGLDNDENSLYDNEPRRKSVNMTECVPVPGSEHVAEIVGRQGTYLEHSVHHPLVTATRLQCSQHESRFATLCHSCRLGWGVSLCSFMRNADFRWNSLVFAPE